MSGIGIGKLGNFVQLIAHILFKPFLMFASFVDILAIGRQLSDRTPIAFTWPDVLFPLLSVLLLIAINSPFTLHHRTEVAGFCASHLSVINH